jgi:signal recognition particle receptor subunit beta
MVVFNYSGGEVNTKLVYYGPGLSGKTTNIEYIYGKMPAQVKGKMISMKTRTDRTLFFDFLPLDLGNINGFKVRFLLYTVPGQVYYNATRKLVLKGADAVVFVADSSPDKLEENIESLKNLEANLNEYNLSLDSIPWVIQYNKRDVENALPVNVLEESLNVLGVPGFEAVATEGRGVYETFQMISSMLYHRVKKKLEDEEEDKPTAFDDSVGGTRIAGRTSTAVEQEEETKLSQVVDSALREIPKAGNKSGAKRLWEQAAVGSIKHDEQPSMREESAGGHERDYLKPRELHVTVDMEKEARTQRENEEFRFASIKEAPMDDQMGRTVDLVDGSMETEQIEKGDFITGPCSLGISPHAGVEEVDEHEGGEDPAKDAPPSASSEELVVRVPVVISPSQVKKNIPLKLVLEIRMLDE